MYSLTLLLALNVGTAQPASHHGEGACFGACYGACHGAAACHGGLFSRLHTRLASFGACHGACHGGFFRHHFHRHRAACYGACVGGHPMPVEPAKPQKPEKIPVKPAEKKADLGNKASLIVFIQEGAKLYIDGEPTQQTGSRRSFITPELPEGKTFYYTLTAELPTGERLERQVTIRAGELVEVEMVTYTIGR